MIPTLLLVGFVLGRWWKLVIPVAAIAWPVLLIADGVDTGLGFAIGVGALAAANTAAGAGVFQAIAALVRSSKRSSGRVLREP